MAAVLLTGGISQAAFSDLDRSAREAAFGGAATAAADGPAAVFKNPALTTGISSTVLSSSWSRLFGLPDLDNISIAVVHPFDFGTISAGVSRLGRTGCYTESEALLAYAGNIDVGIYGNLSVGAAVRGMEVDISPVYGSDRTFGVDAGLLWKKSRRFRTGFAVRNLNAPVLGIDEEALPQVFTAGIAVRPFETVLLAVDAARERFAGFTRSVLRFGQEVRPHRRLALRAGFRTDPAGYTVGAGFFTSSCRIDYAYLFHPVLPGTHMISFQLCLH